MLATILSLVICCAVLGVAVALGLCRAAADADAMLEGDKVITAKAKPSVGKTKRVSAAK
jgi:hypothetical protein